MNLTTKYLGINLRTPLVRASGARSSSVKNAGGLAATLKISASSSAPSLYQNDPAGAAELQTPKSSPAIPPADRNLEVVGRPRSHGS